MGARVADTKRHFRKVGRWVGGQVPCGYMPFPWPAGGRALAIDEKSAAVVREAVRYGGSAP